VARLCRVSWSVTFAKKRPGGASCTYARYHRAIKPKKQAKMPRNEPLRGVFCPCKGPLPDFFVFFACAMSHCLIFLCFLPVQ